MVSIYLICTLLTYYVLGIVWASKLSFEFIGLITWGKSHVFISLPATHYLSNLDARPHEPGNKCRSHFFITNIIPLAETIFPSYFWDSLDGTHMCLEHSVLATVTTCHFFSFLLNRFGYTCSKMLVGDLYESACHPKLYFVCLYVRTLSPLFIFEGMSLNSAKLAV